MTSHFLLESMLGKYQRMKTTKKLQIFSFTQKGGYISDDCIGHWVQSRSHSTYSCSGPMSTGRSIDPGFHYHWAISNKTVNVRSKPIVHTVCRLFRPQPWGLSKVDGFISGCSRENACSLDWRLCIIFLQPTHTSHSPTSDKNLSDRMWLTSFGSRRLNSSVTLLQWPLSSFHCIYVFLSLSSKICHTP